MAHTYSQDLEYRFNTLHSNFIETQQEVGQLSANILSINKKMHSSTTAPVTTSIEEVKQDITTHIESVATMICAKMYIPVDVPLFGPPLHTEGENSSHSQNFHPRHFQCDLRHPRVDVKKFDGSDPTGWVTQMEHYFSLYGITNELAKLHYGVLHLDKECWKGRKIPTKGMWLGHTLW
jgi:hypothetical protein